VTDHDASQDEPIAKRDDLLALFRSAEKPKAEFRVGAEAEKFGVIAATGEPLHYEGDRGVLRIMKELVARHGWTPDAEKPGAPIIALLRKNASITLEPGSQFELTAKKNQLH
jgi:glutamate--cysteine ligase